MSKRLNSIFFCQNAVKSKQGLWSATNIFNSVVVGKLPAVSPAFFLYFNVGDAGDEEYDIYIKAPNSQQVKIASGHQEEEKGPNTTFVLPIESLKVEEEGLYIFSIRVGDELIGSTSLSVSVEDK